MALRTPGALHRSGSVFVTKRRPEQRPPVTLSPPIRRALLALLALLLLWLAWSGLSGGVHQLPQSQTPGQIAQTITQFAFGLFAFLSVVIGIALLLRVGARGLTSEGRGRS